MARIRTKGQAAEIRYGIKLGRVWPVDWSLVLLYSYAETVLGGTLGSRAFERTARKKVWRYKCGHSTI